MTYSFRLRLIRGPGDTLQTESSSLRISSTQGDLPVHLTSKDSQTSLKESEEFIISGDGYESREAASEAGEAYVEALLIACARCRVGIDLGFRSASSTITEAGLKYLEEKIGERVLNSFHGLQVYETFPLPKFVSSTTSLVRGVDVSQFLKILELSIGASPDLTECEVLAFSLFNSSFFQRNVESRFLLLMMSIEALLNPISRSEDVKKHLSTLISITQSSNLEQSEKNSLIGGLKCLSEESISSAGRRLVHSILGNRIYSGRSSKIFFTNCYELRSKLVHGAIPYPSRSEISEICAALELMVSDLLTTPVLG